MIDVKSMKRNAGVLTAALFFAVLLFLCSADNSCGYSAGDIGYTEGITGGAVYFNKETGEITGCDYEVTDAVIPEEIEGVKVTKIGEFAFCGRGHLVSLHIPASVKYISNDANSAFSGCQSLKEITVDEQNQKYKSIGGVLFSVENNGLCLMKYPSAKAEELYAVPEGVGTIGVNSFAECVFLKSIDISEGVTEIKNNAFCGDSAFTQIRISKSVVNIAPSIISGCPSLAAIEVDAENGSFLSEDGVLYNKDKTTLIKYPAGRAGESFSVPEGVKNLSKTAFHACKLKNVYLPDSLQSMEGHAFSYSSELTSIEIPEGVTEIPYSAFYQCEGLKSVTVPYGVTEVGEYAFACCYALRNIELPDSILTMGNGVFSLCNALESANIPDKIKTVGMRTFNGCSSLKSIIIPGEAEKIEQNAFKGCSTLGSFFVLSDNVVFDSGALSDCPVLTIYANENFSAWEYAETGGISCRLLDGSLPQKIICDNSIVKAYGDEPFSIGAEAKTSLSYESSAPEIIEVSQDGIAAVKGAGSAVITITAAREGEYDGARSQVSVTVGRAEQTIEAAQSYSKVYRMAPFKISASAKTPLSYESSAPQIVEVSQDGTASIKGAGKAVIRVTAAESSNYNIAVREIPVYVAKAGQTIYGGSTFTKIFGCDSFGLGASAKTKLAYRSSNTNILTVSSTGRVYLKNPGRAYVYITAAETSNYKQAVRKVSVSSSLKRPVLYAKNIRTRKVKLTWTRVPGAMRYQVYICYPGKRTFVKRLDKSYIVKSVTHSGLRKGKIYKYKVRAYRVVDGRRVYGPFSSIRSVRIYR